MRKHIKKKLDELNEQGLLRSPALIEETRGASGATRVTIEGKEAMVLCSNDYLGLSVHPLVKQAMIEGVEKYGAGAGASRLVSGTMQPHVELEERIARFKGAEKALVFNSGWHANTGCIPALMARGDDIFADRLSHASIIDGCLLSKANLKRFAHGDTDALERLLKKSTASRKLIVTDGVFSMDGDVAPIKEILLLAEKHNASVYIDDAHGVGVMGKTGRGTLEHLGVENHSSVIEVGTFGKAFGTCGAFVTGSEDMVAYLVNRARSFIYSTALPPGVCAASIKAIDIVDNEPERVARLRKRAAFLRAGLKSLGLDTLSSTTHIIPILIKDAKKTMRVTQNLLRLGVFVQGIRPPSVPENTARLRVTVTSEHTKADLEFALKAIKEALCGNNND